ncbi:MAG: TetR family transcriptional regulator [Lachnospiraceae bacterium]|nr:TetR family transcriptional regulator [Lachnospiraceae bacterium]
MAYETASNQRKELIASTLKELLQTKPLSKISVTELVQHCRINRKTFYYHFEDIYALLKWMLEREIIEMLRQYDLLSDYDAALGFALDYIGENYTMLRNIYNSMEVEHLRRFFFHASGK